MTRDPVVATQKVAHLENAIVRYGPKLALRGVSLSLMQSQIYVLMGPNGSGKSTLVRLLTGSIKSSGGPVEVSGQTVGSRMVKSKVGFVPQDIALYPFLTARENCIAFGRMAGLGRQASAGAADDALRKTACSAVADTRISRLSGGFKRRVNIAVALVAEPHLLILDEPTAGIDKEARESIKQTLSSLRTSGTSILMITHDFDDADALADRVGFLSAGALVAEGEPRALIAQSFGSTKRWEIEFTTVPSRLQQDLLTAEGAKQIGAMSWLMFRDEDNTSAMRFVEKLEGGGMTFKDMRLSAPGLQALYHRFCHTDAAA